MDSKSQVEIGPCKWNQSWRKQSLGSFISAGRRKPPVLQPVTRFLSWLFALLRLSLVVVLPSSWGSWWIGWVATQP